MATCHMYTQSYTMELIYYICINLILLANGVLPLCVQICQILHIIYV
jgi:hypothetical protein